MDYKTLQFDTKEADAEGHISGYGAVFGNEDQGGDIIVAKAFDVSLTKNAASGKKVKMLWQHDPAQPIGVWDTVTADEHGLFMKGRLLPEVAKAKEAIALLRAGAIDGLSIGYKTVDSVMKKGASRMIREIKEAALWETSIVTFPMNEEALVTDVKQLQSPRDVEQLLRKAGVPGGFAKLVALHGFDAATERLQADPGHGDDEAKSAQLRALQEKLNILKEAFNA